MAARSTWEEPRERRETSAEVEVRECEMKARFARRNISLVGDSITASPSGDAS